MIRLPPRSTRTDPLFPATTLFRSIGAQGLGGLATVLDVKIADWPTHAASKPVAMIPNCAATRHAHVTLDGSGPAFLEPPVLADYPQSDWAPDKAAIRVDLDNLTPELVAGWRQGDRPLLNGQLHNAPAPTPNRNPDPTP